jgi:aminoglycoside phosphotransferase (APT) family kinase protein
MIEPEKTLEQVSNGLIAYLRAELDDPAIEYEIPPTRMQGGYETYTYGFKLRGAEQELSNPLVLRLYPRFYGTANAVWESTIQNVLADQRYPVARVHFVCTDMSILGGAFYVMACLPGKLLMEAPFETIPGLLGRAHASLHSIDPAPLVKTLRERGFDERRYTLDGRFDLLLKRANEYPWLGDAVEWLVENRPPEPERLSVCHGDFHPLNILFQDGQVTGVLDWPGFIVADPVLDVANTTVLTAISGKHLLGLESPEMAIEMYLDAYQAERPLDLEHLDYYRARRSVYALLEGAGGQQVWQRPAIVQDLVEHTHRITGIRIAPQHSP